MELKLNRVSKWALMLIIIHALIPAIRCCQNSSVISIREIVISEHDVMHIMQTTICPYKR